MTLTNNRLMKATGASFVLLVLSLTFFACKDKSKSEAQTEKPNVVFIFADDMTYTAINALGNSEVKTPHLDRLVNSGTTFTHAYNMGGWNGAVCIASRSMIISGQSVWNANETRKQWPNGTHLNKTWGQLMESAGYDTYMTGKWHIDAPADSVFQSVTHIRPGMPGDAWDHETMVKTFDSLSKAGDTDLEKVMPVGYNRPLHENDTTWSPTDPKFGGFWEGGKHWSEVLKDDAFGFIEKTKGSPNPFFMYLAFNAPHDPRQAPQEYFDLYPVENISLPKSWAPLYADRDGIGSGQTLRDEALAPFPRTEYALKKHIQEYYAIITHLDDQIGAILDELETTGKMDNTYVIFTADHGLAMGKHGLLGKQSLFDHSIRAPFMIMGPGIPKGKRVGHDIYLQDAMATSLELAGMEKPDHVFFNSVIKLAKGEQESSNYDAVYGAYVDWQRMIRKDGYKLLVYPKIKKKLLFDLTNDPEEMQDLSNSPEHQERVNELFKELVQLQKSMNDPLDLTTVFK